MNIKLGPIIIGVKSIAESKNFYIQVFNFEPREASSNYLSGYIGDTHVEIEEDSEHRLPYWKNGNIGTYKNAQWIVSDMDIFIEKVVEHGGKVMSKPQKKPWGSIVAEIADPDSNIFLISQEP